MQRAELTKHLETPNGNQTAVSPQSVSRTSFLKRQLFQARTMFADKYRTLSRWKIAVRGWTGISFYSLDLALSFARAFLRVSPHLNPKDLIHWTNCGVRLTRADMKLAGEFFADSEIILKIPPKTRSQLFIFIYNSSFKQIGETLRKGFRTAMRFAAAAKDDELTARSLEVATKIGRRSYYGNEIFNPLEEIVRHLTENNLFQRNLFLHLLDLAAQFQGKFAIEFLNAASPLIKNAQSAGAMTRATLLAERLMQHAEPFITADETGAINFFLCGLEFLKLDDAALIDKWAALCQKFKDSKERISANFTAAAIEPTKTLVSLAQKFDKPQAVRVVTAVFETTIRVGEKSITAAANCYATSPALLEKMSVTAYLEWAERGLTAFSERDKLAAYFAAESRSSQTAIGASEDALRLEDVLPVLTNYVQMLTGKDVPIVPRPQKYDVLEPDTEDSIGLPPTINEQCDAEQRFRIYKTLAAQRAGQIEFGTFEKGTERLQKLGETLLQKYPRFPAARLNGKTDWHTLVTLFPLTTLARRLFTILENARVEYLLKQKYRGLKRDLEFARVRRNQVKPPDQYLMKYEPLLEQLFVETLGAKIETSAEDEQSDWLDKAREVLSAYIYKNNSSLTDTIHACLALYEFLDPEAPESSLPWEDPHNRPDFEQDEQLAEQSPNERSEIVKQTADSGEKEAGQIMSAEAMPGTGIFTSGSSASDDADSLDEKVAPNVFYYDEWDSRINDYRPRWCRVVESDWQASDLIFARRTRAEYHGVLTQIRSQFQMLRPTGLKKIHGQLDGEELDLDALTDFVADKHAHHTPSDRIYTERRNRERDVAVCFLLDMSGSTNARISKNKRVLDVEKEALLLMSEALEAIGDAYAIYGFSSQGRRRVSFYRFKDFDEPYGEQIERRISAARCLVNTRLGAAVRHATWHLNRQPSATRLLIVLSDARPSDEEYNWLNAPADTRAAFQEARASGVTPFCITFDQGNRLAETEQMFEGFGYTVIDNVLSLPERMPGIYRRLTT